MRGQEVALVGGGNSAGQAAVYLAGQATKVWLLVRGPELASSMSRYLVDRMAELPNVEASCPIRRCAMVPSKAASANGIKARNPLREPQATCARSQLKQGIGVSISENRATVANVDRLRDLVLNWISAS